jgi:hypothetical protein
VHLYSGLARIQITSYQPKITFEETSMDQNYSQLPPAPLAPPTSTLAIVSLISGIVSWFLLPFIAAIAAVITGHMAKNEIRKSNGTLGGNGMATAGLVLGYVQLGLGVCLCLIVAAMLAFGMTIPFIGNSIH